MSEPDLIARLAQAFAAAKAQRETDQRPCPKCGGDPLRPDYRQPGQPCHAPWPTPEGDTHA